MVYSLGSIVWTFDGDEDCVEAMTDDAGDGGGRSWYENVDTVRRKSKQYCARVGWDAKWMYLSCRLVKYDSLRFALHVKWPTLEKTMKRIPTERRTR